VGSHLGGLEYTAIVAQAARRCVQRHGDGAFQDEYGVRVEQKLRSKFPTRREAERALGAKDLERALDVHAERSLVQACRDQFRKAVKHGVAAALEGAESSLLEFACWETARQAVAAVDDVVALTAGNGVAGEVDRRSAEVVRRCFLDPPPPEWRRLDRVRAAELVVGELESRIPRTAPLTRLLHDSARRACAQPAEGDTAKLRRVLCTRTWQLVLAGYLEQVAAAAREADAGSSQRTAIGEAMSDCSAFAECLKFADVEASFAARVQLHLSRERKGWARLAELTEADEAQLEPDITHDYDEPAYLKVVGAGFHALPYTLPGGLTRAQVWTMFGLAVSTALSALTEAERAVLCAHDQAVRRFRADCGARRLLSRDGFIRADVLTDGGLPQRAAARFVALAAGESVEFQGDQRIRYALAAEINDPASVGSYTKLVRSAGLQWPALEDALEPIATFLRELKHARQQALESLVALDAVLLYEIGLGRRNPETHATALNPWLDNGRIIHRGDVFVHLPERPYGAPDAEQAAEQFMTAEGRRGSWWYFPDGGVDV
jgi:hypothetical protein